MSLYHCRIVSCAVSLLDGSPCLRLGSECKAIGWPLCTLIIVLLIVHGPVHLVVVACSKKRHVLECKRSSRQHVQEQVTCAPPLHGAKVGMNNILVQQVPRHRSLQCFLACSQVDHHVLVAEEKHDGDWIVQLVPCHPFYTPSLITVKLHAGLRESSLTWGQSG